MNSRPSGANHARILPFKRPRRNRPRAISMIVRPSTFTLPKHCESSPEYKHEWKSTDIPGWAWCVHCKGWIVDTTAKVVNMFPDNETFFNYCPASQSHKHCAHDLAKEGNPEIVRCCWCGMEWKWQPKNRASEAK
jgi:hypothetical protein